MINIATGYLGFFFVYTNSSKIFNIFRDNGYPFELKIVTETDFRVQFVPGLSKYNKITDLFLPQNLREKLAKYSTNTMQIFN